MPLSGTMRRRSSFCASSSETNVQGTLTYDKLFLDQNNVEGASLDTSSGKFTAGLSGSYQVMISAEVVSLPGQDHSIWVAVNDEKKVESLIQIMADKNMYGAGFDNTSRDIVLNLTAGQTVSIIFETEGNEKVVNGIFCISYMKVKESN